MLKRALFFLTVFLAVQSGNAQTQSFNSGWEFIKDIDTAFSASLSAKNSALKWEKVTLPHTANIEPIHKVAQQWQGICFYRKFFTIPSTANGKHIALQFDAAMQDATVYLNGKQIFRHLGGYLPFYIDISGQIQPGVENTLVVKLDNKDNPLIPPGKPIKTLDFNYYSGIYRNTWIIVKDKLHISNAVAANKVAGGGVFVYYDQVTPQSASLILKTDVANDHSVPQNVQIRAKLTDRLGKTVASALSATQSVSGGSSQAFDQTLTVRAPQLWEPENPYLYQLTVEVLKNGVVADRQIVSTGIKKTRIEGGALYLNDKKVKIRGTNRHQDYPWIGNAVSDNAQYRDAYKIKLAGFNFVRTSHYPQATSFLSACDELGILVMDAIPGWQFVGNTVFQENSFQNIRDMIRRDRNHPSIILWEASLNESNMRKEYKDKAYAIVHEELPFPGIYSAGWQDSGFDVYLPARQHGKSPDYWKKYNKPMPLLIAEYGDWEYYAQNAGFNQTEYKDLKAEERTSRQERGFGEKRLLQQALNYQEAHNDNLYGADMGDANWLMFDYNRGYAEDIESSGIMDMNRLPKFSFYFYKSQVDPLNTNAFNKPMVSIANYWSPTSEPTVKVYSNCEEVELLLDGKSVGRQKPDNDQYSVNLKHPPFTFQLEAFKPGTLTAIGYINNKKIVQEQQATAGPAAMLRLRVDYSGKDLQSGVNDAVFVYADITDNKGNIVYNAGHPVEFKLTGDAEIVGKNPEAAEAGIAAILVKSGARPGKITVSATAKDLKGAVLVLNAK